MCTPRRQCKANVPLKGTNVNCNKVYTRGVCCVWQHRNVVGGVSGVITVAASQTTVFRKTFQEPQPVEGACVRW